MNMFAYMRKISYLCSVKLCAIAKSDNNHLNTILL